MGMRILKWFIFNVFFGLLPLILAVSFRALAGQEFYPTIRDSPEILFFVLMITTTAMGDLFEMSVRVGWDLILASLFFGMLVGAVVAAAFYGGLVYSTLMTPEATGFRTGLLTVGQWAALIYTVAGFCVQRLVGKSGVNSGEPPA
jgi:hypothetical protein